MIENQLRRARRANAELVFLLADAEPGKVALDREGGDSLVPLGEVHIGENDVQARLGAVRDPQFPPVENPAVAAARRLGLEAERVRSRGRLGEGVGADDIGGEAREVAVLEPVARPLEEQRVDEGVLNVDEDRRRRVDGRQLLDGEHGHEQAAPSAAERLRNLDSHQAELEHLGQQRRIELGRLLHRGDARPHLALGEVAHGVAEHLLLFGQPGQGWAHRAGGGGHQDFRSGPASMSRIPPSELSTAVAS